MNVSSGRLLATTLGCFLAAAWLGLPVALPQASPPGTATSSGTAMSSGTAAPSGSAPPAGRYSDAVVAKATNILAAAGIQRSGKTLLASGASELNRELANLPKARRAIKLLVDERKRTEEQLARTRQQFQLLDAQNGELNLRLAGPVPVQTNNQLVGMINANHVRLRQLDAQRDQLREKLAADRKAVHQAEAQYAETALKLRRQFSALQAELEPALQDEQLRIALQVLHTNFQTPPTLDIAILLGATDRRLKQIEKEIFSEAIPLVAAPSGALSVDVAIGEASTSMVLDSGASLICLPAETAAQLGISVAADAQPLRLVMADGRTIPARGVVLPLVRVGQFAAENVEAAVLDAAAINAQPLLGMSFLSNFRFEIDSPGRTLRLLRVGEDDN